MNFTRFLRHLAIAAAACFASVTASAAPIDIGYQVTGTAGNWIYDFTVNNHLGGTNRVYFFGVKLGASDVVGSPANFGIQSVSWTNQGYRGSNTIYNNNWIGAGIASGTSLGGFKVHVTDLIAPAQVAWFAYATGGTYTAGGNFNSVTNPGFEGVAGNQVPEPATMLLLAVGLGGAGLARRKRSV